MQATLCPVTNEWSPHSKSEMLLQQNNFPNTIWNEKMKYEIVSIGTRTKCFTIVTKVLYGQKVTSCNQLLCRYLPELPRFPLPRLALQKSGKGSVLPHQNRGTLTSHSQIPFHIFLEQSRIYNGTKLLHQMNYSMKKTKLLEYDCFKSEKYVVVTVTNCRLWLTVA